MSDHVRRAAFWRVNRFQLPIMSMALIPTLIFCVAGSVLVLYGQRELITYLNANPNLQQTELVNWGGAYLLGLIWLFFGTMVIWVRIVSGRMVGAMERIIREMDFAIQDEDRGPIRARDGDFLAGLLISRINRLIEKGRAATPAPRMWKTTEAM